MYIIGEPSYGVTSIIERMEKADLFLDHKTGADKDARGDRKGDSDAGDSV